MDVYVTQTERIFDRMPNGCSVFAQITIDENTNRYPSSKAAYKTAWPVLVLNINEY